MKPNMHLLVQVYKEHAINILNLNLANDTQALLASEDDTDHEVTVPASGTCNACGVIQ